MSVQQLHQYITRKSSELADLATGDLAVSRRRELESVIAAATARYGELMFAAAPAPAGDAGNTFEAAGNGQGVQEVQQGVADMHADGSGQAGMAQAAAPNAAALAADRLAAARPKASKAANRRRRDLCHRAWARVRKGANDVAHAARWGTDPALNPQLRMHQQEVPAKTIERQHICRDAKQRAILEAMADGISDQHDLMRIGRRAWKEVSRCLALVATAGGKTSAINGGVALYDHDQQELDTEATTPDGTLIPIDVLRDAHTGSKKLIAVPLKKDVEEAVKEGIDPKFVSQSTAACALGQQGWGLSSALIEEFANEGYICSEGFDADKYKRSTNIICTVAMAVRRFANGDFKLKDFDSVWIDEVDVAGQAQEEDGGLERDDHSRFTWATLFERLGETAIFYMFSGTAAAWMDSLPRFVQYSLGDSYRDGNLCQFNVIELVPEGLTLHGVGDLDEVTGQRSWTCHATNPNQLTNQQKKWLREHPDAIRAYLRTFVKMLLIHGDATQGGPGVCFQALVLVPKEGNNRGSRISIVQRITDLLREVIEQGAGDMFPPDAPYRAHRHGTGSLTCAAIYSGLGARESERTLEEYRKGSIDILVGDEIPRRAMNVPTCKFLFQMRKHLEEPGAQPHPDDEAAMRNFIKAMNDYRQSESSLGQGAGRVARRIKNLHATGRRAYAARPIGTYVAQFQPTAAVPDPPREPCYIVELSFNENAATFARYLARNNAADALMLNNPINVANVQLAAGVEAGNDDDEFVAPSDDDDSSDSESSDGSDDDDDDDEPAPVRQQRAPVRPSRQLTAEERAARLERRQQQESERARAAEDARQRERQQQLDREQARLSRHRNREALANPEMTRWAQTMPTVTTFVNGSGNRMLRVTIAPPRTGVSCTLSVWASESGRARGEAARDQAQNWGGRAVRDNIVLPPAGVDMTADIAYRPEWRRLCVRAVFSGANRAPHACCPLLLSSSAMNAAFEVREAQRCEEPTAPAQPQAAVVVLPAAPAGGSSSASVSSLGLPVVRQWSVEQLSASRQGELADRLDGTLLSDNSTKSDIYLPIIHRAFCNSGHPTDAEAAGYHEMFHALVAIIPPRDEEGEVIDGPSPLEVEADLIIDRCADASASAEMQALLIPGVWVNRQKAEDARVRASLPPARAAAYMGFPYVHACPEQYVQPLLDDAGVPVGMSYPLWVDGIGYTQEGMLSVAGAARFNNIQECVARHEIALRDDVVSHNGSDVASDGGNANRATVTEMLPQIPLGVTFTVPTATTLATVNPAHPLSAGVSAGGSLTRQPTVPPPTAVPPTTTPPPSAPPVTAPPATTPPATAPPPVWVPSPPPPPPPTPPPPTPPPPAPVYIAFPPNNLHATALGHQPMFAYMQRMQMAGNSLSMSQRETLQSVELGVDRRTGASTQRRPGQAQPVAQAPAAQPVARAPAAVPTTFMIGENEIAFIRSNCPYELSEAVEQEFRARLVTGGVFNGRSRRPRSEEQARMACSRLVRGVFIGIKASQVEPGQYPALGFGAGTHATNCSTLYDFLQHRIPLMLPRCSLAELAIRENWAHAATPGHEPATSEQRSAMQLFLDYMFDDVQRVRHTFPAEIDGDSDNLYVRMLRDGSNHDPMSIHDATAALARFYKGASIIVKAAAEGRAFPLLNSAQATLRERSVQLSADAALTEWALLNALAADANECVAMQTAIDDYCEYTMQAAAPRGRGRPAAGTAPVVRSPAPPAVGQRRRRGEV